MNLRILLSVASLGVAALAASPASAFSITPMPQNADGSARFADPDAAIENQAEAYERGQSNGWHFNGASRNRSVGGLRDARTGRSEHSDRRDHTCIECSSVNIDGVWLLRPNGEENR